MAAGHRVGCSLRILPLALEITPPAQRTETQVKWNKWILESVAQVHKCNAQVQCTSAQGHKCYRASLWKFPLFLEARIFTLAFSTLDVWTQLGFPVKKIIFVQIPVIQIWQTWLMSLFAIFFALKSKLQNHLYKSRTLDICKNDLLSFPFEQPCFKNHRPAMIYLFNINYFFQVMSFFNWHPTLMWQYMMWKPPTPP